jgi:hypothetical protein
MSRQKHTQRIKNLLLAFVLVSIGFAMGRHSVKSKEAELPGMTDKSVIHVYYLHSTFRCTTCNTIEKMTKEFLDGNYKSELASGKMIFTEIDFQQNEQIAKRFGVVASCVVVAAEKDGKTVAFKRLDEVWTKMKTPDEFDKYIAAAITAMRAELASGGEK